LYHLTVLLLLVVFYVFGKRFVLLLLLFIELAFFFDLSFLVLLVFRDQIVHVRLGFGEFHLVHALASVPMQKRLATEHGTELFGDALEQSLDGSGVTDESGRDRSECRWDVADRRFHVVGDPFDEIRGEFVLDLHHLVIDFLCRHFASKRSRGSQVTTLAGIASSHHVFGLEDLRGQLGDTQLTVLSDVASLQRSKTDHEEMETRERDQIDGEFAEIGVELTRETERRCDSSHDDGDQMVQVAVRWVGEFERAEANVVQRFVVDAHHGVGVFNELMDRESGVVRLNDGVRDLR